MSTQFWTKEDEDKLRAMASTEMLVRDMAKALGKGLSRNAIIGKAWRLKLTLRKVTPKPKVTPTPKPTGNQVFLLSLNSNMCRFPVDGDGAKTLFCGDPTERGSWCPNHRKRVFYPKSAVKRGEEDVKLRKESKGFLPDANSFRFGSEAD